MTEIRAFLVTVVTVLAFMLGAIAVSHCGGAEFFTASPWRDGGSVDDAAAAGDDAALPQPQAIGPEASPAVDGPSEIGAGDAGRALPPSPATDAGDDPVTTGKEAGAEGPPDVYVAPPPPPALCCVTPCSGSAPAAITCGNGPAWTCAAGSCAGDACSVGAACTWMSVCQGHVAVCP